MAIGWLAKGALAAAALMLLSGCFATAQPRHGGYPHHGRGYVHIPPGHLPPSGACRIWFPDRPPGHQPPPGPCRALQRHVPPGALLVYG